MRPASGKTDVEYRWKASDDLEAYFGGTVSFQSSSFGDIGHGPDFKIDSYALVDLRAGVQSDKWSASIWGRNVLNKYYATSAGNTGDFITRYTGRPATYGVRVSYRY